MPPARVEILAGMKVRRCDIPGYFTEDFAAGLRMWGDYQRFGLPYDGGWATQPAPLIALFRLFDGEQAAWQESKNDSRRAKAGH